ncbi:MAG TPA: hypothetical protein VK789_15165 [Bryobacteraceae bacterium]|nr:hypothetical protein [Bryobacteraceae bacterium]
MLVPLILSLMLASNSKAPAPPAPALPRAVPRCGTITKTQIETALGHLLNRETDEYTKLACIRTFFSDDVEVTISVQHLGQSLDIPAELHNLEESMPDSKLWEVNTVSGGRVFALDIPGTGLQLHVLPDRREYVLVSVEGLSEGDHGYQAAMDIARTLMNGY